MSTREGGVAVARRKQRRIAVGAIIAEGSQSVVRMGRDVETFEACAVKLTKLDEASGGASAYENEIDILTRLTHRNVPKYYGSFRRQHVGFLILEYFPFPTLAKYLVESGSLPEDRALYVFRQLLDVVYSMALQGVAHRDLKSENVIINPDTLLVKVIDFGLSAVIPHMDFEDDTFLGTPTYMSPEILAGGTYNIVKADTWSLGMLLWEMLLGTQPYSHCKSKFALVDIQHRARDFSMFKNTTSELLHGLLTNSPAKRWTVLEALAFVDEHIRPPIPRSLRNAPAREHLLTYTNKRTQTQRLLKSTVDPVAD